MDRMRFLRRQKPAACGTRLTATNGSRFHGIMWNGLLLGGAHVETLLERLVRMRLGTCLGLCGAQLQRHFLTFDACLGERESTASYFAPKRRSRALLLVRLSFQVHEVVVECQSTVVFPEQVTISTGVNGLRTMPLQSGESLGCDACVTIASLR